MEGLYIVPVADNLLRRLAEQIIHEGEPENKVLLFPHRRAIAFARYYMAKLMRKPFLLPRMFSFKDWVHRVYVDTCDNPLPVASEWELSWMAYRAAEEVLGSSKVPSWGDFLGWSLRMVGLFKELDEELVSVENIEYPSDTLPDRAKAILERIGDIYGKYREILERNGYTTHSAILRWLAQEGRVPASDNTHVVGFFALTRAEAHIFRKMYEKGASFWWHADPDNLPRIYRRWFRGEDTEDRWVFPSELEKIPDEDVDKVCSEPEIHLFEANSLHMEVDELFRRLKGLKVEEPDEVAVVLLSPDALVPVVMRLPDSVEANVSLGYPLKHTGLFSFLKAIESLLESKREGRYRVSEVVELLRYPYMGDNRSVVEELLKRGSPYIERLPSPLDGILAPFESARTPGAFSRAMEGLFDWLLKHGRLSIVEKGFLARMVETVLLPMRSPLIRDCQMQVSSLFRMVEGMASRTTLPFEGEPLTGLQILGILETRLLSFKRLFVLDANDDVIPGVEEVNPLLPADVRKVLGLPERERREAIAKYHFERLVGSAKEVHIFWQNKVSPDRLGIESKKVRSRFVDAIVWRREKKAGGLLPDIVSRRELRIDAGKLLDVDFPEKRDEEREVLLERLKSPVSPTFIDSYIRCPLSFYYSQVLGLEDTKVPAEVEPSLVGEALHKALEEYYSRFLGREVSRDHLNAEEIFGIFKRLLKASDHFRHLHEAREFILLETAKFRIERFVKGQPDKVKVVGVERELAGSVEVDGLGVVTFKGVADRIDDRGHYYAVVDYKTGYFPKLRWSTVKSKVSPKNGDIVQLVRRYLPSVQLPLYAHLWGRVCDDRPAVGVYVDLRKDGVEEMFPDNERFLEDYRLWLNDEFISIVGLILNEMVYGKHWVPVSDAKICGYCSFRGICRFSV